MKGLKGYSKQEGIDYQETFSLVFKMKTAKSVLALVAIKGWHIYQIDIFNAFLQGDLFVEIYVQLPQGFLSQGENIVCRLKTNSLYGLNGLQDMECQTN